MSLVLSLQLHALILLYFYEKPADNYAAASRPEFLQVKLDLISIKNNKKFSIEAFSSTAAAHHPVIPATAKKIVITPDNEFSGYFKNSELDAGPKPFGEIVVPLPDNNIDEIRGHVILEVYINALGGVDSVEELYRNVPYEYAQSAIRAFSRALFIPGKKDGNNQPAMMKIQVDFLGNEAEPIRSE